MSEGVAEGPPKPPKGASREYPSPAGPPARRDPLDASPAPDAAALGAPTAAGPEPPIPHGEKKAKKKKAKKKEGLGTARGIETMFRTSYQTHNDLSALADNKANIMISINGIIISILIASIAPQLGTSGWLLLPTSVLLVGCLASLVYAVLAARPRVSRHQVSVDSVRGGKSNILFFGNFVRMREEDYVEGMQELMQDTDRVYLNMIRDIYSLGGILERKFRLLRVSYTLFMVGLVAGVLLFIVTYAVAGMAGPF